METKINITTILKDKPKGTKLYSTVHGECTFETITDEFFKINFCTSKFGLTQTGECVLIKFGNMFDGGECVVFPSKEMRNWSKFAWKKGDVLVSNDSDNHIIFKGFSKNDYTTFEGKHWISVSKKRHVSCLEMQNVQDYHIEDNKDSAQTYINTIEERLGGKLNMETLEIDKTQPEFKDGDILCVIDSSDDYHYILIYKGQDDKYIYHYVTMFENNSLYIRKDAHLTKPKDYSMRYATEEEKKQLFSALEKEGKRWDSGKKEVVDLKPKCEFKPMDLCLMKYIGQYNNRGWELCQYAYTEHRVSSSGEQRDFYHAVGGEIYAECIPYKGNEHLLGTKKSK